MFGRCPPRVRVTVVRLDIKTVVKRVQTSHLPRLAGLLVLLIQTSREYRRMREHSKYACRYCGSECNDRNQLLHHVKTMHDGRQCACRQCRRSYVSISGLNEHVKKMHNKRYRYRCETYKRGFMDRCLYHDHIAAHTGVKRYKCSICDMKFTNKRALKSHVLHLHPN